MSLARAAGLAEKGGTEGATLNDITMIDRILYETTGDSSFGASFVVNFRL
jgi:hypothetical protein